jgi:type I restriction enzyme S subunit
LDKYKVVAINDLVLNRFNAYRGALGVAAEAGLVSPDYSTLRTIRGDSRYFDYWFRSSEVANAMKATMGGLGAQDPDSSGFSRVDMGTVLKLRVHVSKVESQRAIADFLDQELAQIEDLVQKQKCLINLIEERSAAAIRKMVNSEGNACVKKLKHVASINFGHPFAADMFSTDGPLGVVRQGDFFNSGTTTYTSEHAPKSAMIHNGDLLVSLSGDFNSVRWQGGDAALNQRCAVIRPKSVDVDEDWLAYAVEIGLDDVTASNVSTTVSNMSAAELRSLRVPLPPIHVQREMSQELKAELSRMANLCLSASALLATFSERRSALINAAVTGKIDFRGKN